MGTTTWSPLASGLLTGKYNDGVPADSRLASDDYAWLQRDVLGDEASRRLPRARAFTALAAELGVGRSEEHTSELQSLMRISYAVFCLKKKNRKKENKVK